MKKKLMVLKQVRKDTQKIIRDGFGIYLTWIGWCEKCKRFISHVEPSNMSYSSPRCSNGHKSFGLIANDLLKKMFNEEPVLRFKKIK